MRSQPQLSLLARGGAFALLFGIAVVFGAFVFQCLYWLRFDSWFDWTDPNGPRFPGPDWSGSEWKGTQAILDLFVTAPVQLFASITGLILVVLYICVRRFSQRS